MELAKDEELVVVAVKPDEDNVEDEAENLSSLAGVGPNLDAVTDDDAAVAVFIALSPAIKVVVEAEIRGLFRG